MKPSFIAARAAAFTLFAFFQFASSLFAQPGAGSPLGKTDIPAYLNEAPFPPKTTGEAERRVSGADWRNPDVSALDRFYQPFTDKVTQAAQTYQQYYGDRLQHYYGQQSESSMQAQSKAQIDQNPIIASMGGVEKVAQMNPEEARAAATRATAAYAADPFAANGVQSAGMTALYQKIVSDPAYAARFQNMTEKEREAELRKYMANDKPQVKTAAQMEQDRQRKEQQALQNNKVRSAMMFQEQLPVFQTKIGEAENRYAQQCAELLASPGNHQEIDAAYQKKYAAIPMVELGEYGHDKDPVQAQQLNLEMAIRHQAFAAKVLEQDIVLLARLRTDFNSIIAEYTDFFNAHRAEINGNLADQMNGTETESMLGGFEAGLLGLAQQIAGYSKSCTREAASWERNLLEKKAAMPTGK